ncbi:MAG: DUF4062 domain-containing protein [Anaerolineales bacterium]|nr:DUF4062 domain-containing protein [Anaerolineales bacterium]
MEKLKIFISGTQDDMQPERDAVDRAVVSTKLSTGIRAETTASQTQSPRAWIEQQIDECNIYIGVYSHRYGWVIPDENVSATEFEFDLALKSGKPVLVWIRKLREEEKSKPNFDRQEQFLNRVSDFTTGHLRQEFDNPNDLEKGVTTSLGETFTEIIRRGTTPSGKSLLEKMGNKSLGEQGNENIKLLKEKFFRITSRNLRKIQTKIPGLKEPLVRSEAILVEGQLLKGQHVVLTGEAGTGKSGIAARIAQNAMETGKATLLIDARDISTSQTEKDLREYLDLTDSFVSTIEQICDVNECRIILDQLDNVAGLRSAKIVVELIQELVQGINGLELMAVCRNKELHERDLLNGLLSNGLAEVICNEITQDQVANVLGLIDVKDYSPEVLSFGKNLLNLELIGQIHSQQPDFDFSTLTDVVYLWEKYIDTWYVREGRDAGEEMFKYAANLSRLGLNHPDGIIEREMPAPAALQRLVSWGIITFVEGRMYRFRHEKFQDYIYARDAADRLLLPQSILNEIPDHKSRNVFWWVESIYASRSSSMRLRFFEEVFNG